MTSNPPAQLLIGLEVESVEMPKKVSDCRGPGTCPVFRCEFNVALSVTKNRLKPRRKGKRRKPDTETISIGGRGGTGWGCSLATRRTESGMVDAGHGTTYIANLAVDYADSLPSLCLLDYIENPDLVPTKRPDGPAVHMTLRQIGKVLRISREAARKLLRSAIAKVQESEHFADWMELVLELAALRARKEPVYPPKQEKRSKWAELDAAIEESLRRIEAEKQGQRPDVPVSRLLRKP